MYSRIPKVIAAALFLALMAPTAALAAPGGNGNGKGGGAPAAEAPAGVKTKGEAKVETSTDDTLAPCPEIPVEPETPAEETPAEEAPAEETPAEEAPAEETPDAPAEETTCDAEQPSRSKAAHAKVGARLQAMLDAGKIANPTARANVEAVIAKMLAEKDAEATDEEALAEIEEAIEAEAETASAEELDVLAEVQVRQGKKTEAKETLKARLEKNHRTKAAYEALLTLEAEAGEKQDLDTFVNGKKLGFDVRPTVRDGRTLSPIRALVEAVGAEVKWDGVARTVTITKGETTIVLTIGSNIALINGEEVELEVSAQIIDDRTLIPARAVVERLGYYVSWLAEHRSILITDQPIEE